MVWAGSFDSRGNPVLQIRIAAGADVSAGVEVTAIIDTGYTGFVLLPAQFIVSLGLRVQGTTVVTLADESQCICFVAEAYVGLDEKVIKQGIVTLEQKSKEILIGMGFLRQFKLALTMTSKTVLLIDESALDDLRRKATTSNEPEPPSALSVSVRQN